MSLEVDQNPDIEEDHEDKRECSCDNQSEPNCVSCDVGGIISQFGVDKASNIALFVSHGGQLKKSWQINDRANDQNPNDIIAGFSHNE